MKSNKLGSFILQIITLVWCISFLDVHAQSIQDKENQIQNYVQSIFNENEPGAVILVAKNGIPFIREGYGLADIYKRTLLNPNHSMAIGSLSKQFTALVIFKLAEQKKILLDDDITKYFPAVSKFRGITIHNLLTHSSGIKDLFAIDEWRQDLTTDLTRQQTFDLIAKEDLEFITGEKTKYSNSGYHLLGMIIEMVAGDSLNHFIQKTIFNPAGMSHTRFIDERDGDMPTAMGYEKRDGKIIKPFRVSKTRFYAGGSVITTVDDLLKWDEILYTENLVTKKTLDKYFETFVLNTGEKSVNACGWEVTSYNGIKIYGHGGGINGFVSQVYRIPAEHLYIVVLSNLIDRNTKRGITGIAQKIAAIMLDDKISENETPGISLSREEIYKYGGEYRLPDNSIRRILIEDDKVYYQLTAAKKVELIPESKTTSRGRATRNFR